MTAKYKYKRIRVRIKPTKKRPLVEKWEDANEIKKLNPAYKNMPLKGSPKYKPKVKKKFSGKKFLNAIGNPYSVKL